MDLISTQDLIARLPGKLTEGAAKRVMSRLGVRPFAFGPGRGLGDWWDWEEVQTAMRRFRDGKPAPRPEKPKPSRVRHDHAADAFRKPYALARQELTPAGETQ